MFFCSFFYGIWIAFGEVSSALPAAQPISLTRRVCTMANLNQDEIPSDSHHPSLLAKCLNSSISSLEPDVVLQQENITCRHALVVNLFHWISTFKISKPTFRKMDLRGYLSFFEILSRTISEFEPTPLYNCTSCDVKIN